MDSELSEACVTAIKQAAKPISLSDIGAACLGRSKPTTKLVEVLRQLTGRAVIHQWPSYRRSHIFSSVPLPMAVEEAFLTALEDAPLTVAQAAKPVSHIIGRVSEESALAELRRVAPKLASARKIMQIPVGRQSVVYMSVPYLGHIVPTKPSNAAEELILEVVTRLQPGAGNYVAVEKIRHSAELRRFIDAAVIALAARGKLVLAPYGGPRPETDEERSRYVADARGELFIGIALPRTE